jgi:hypothetical protein
MTVSALLRLCLASADGVDWLPYVSTGTMLSLGAGPVADGLCWASLGAVSKSCS